MKQLCSVCAIVLIAAQLPAGQLSLSGTWTVASPGWSVFFRQTGAATTGWVSHCATVLSRETELHDIKVDGDGIEFRCTSPDQTRLITFVGRRSGDELHLRWSKTTLKDGVDTSAVDKRFGASAGQLIATRSPDGELAEIANRVRGMTFAAAVNVPAKNVKAEGLLFVPDSVKQVRSALVIIRYALGNGIHNAQSWRRLCESIDAALLSVRFSGMRSGTGGATGVEQVDAGAGAVVELLSRIGRESGHSELQHVPFVLWGHSAGGGLVSQLAAVRPERTLAFVRHLSGPITGELGIVSKIPALLTAAGRDSTAPAQGSEALWKSGRALAAPWTFALAPEARHNDLEEFDALTTAWIAGVVRQRLAAQGRSLRVITDASAWLGDNATGEASPYGSFTGTKTTANWLPDEPTTREWRALRSATK